MARQPIMVGTSNRGAACPMMVRKQIETDWEPTRPFKDICSCLLELNSLHSPHLLKAPALIISICWYQTPNTLAFEKTWILWHSHVLTHLVLMRVPSTWHREEGTFFTHENSLWKGLVGCFKQHSDSVTFQQRAPFSDTAISHMCQQISVRHRGEDPIMTLRRKKV